MNFLDKDTFCQKSVELNEEVVRAMRGYFALTGQDTAELRIQSYPKISDYLAKAGSLETACTALKCFLETNAEQPIQQNRSDYFFTQNDLNDGLAQYQKSQSFKGISKSLEWGRSGGYKRDPDPPKTAKVLFSYINDYLTKGKAINFYHLLDDPKSLTDEQTNANHKIFCYHAERLARIVQQQPGAFIPQKGRDAGVGEKSGANKELTGDAAEQKSSLDAASERIDSILLAAEDYMITVMATFPHRSNTPDQGGTKKSAKPR